MNDARPTGLRPAAPSTRSAAPSTRPAAPSTRSTRVAAFAWLVHPVSLAGMVVLLLNDHMLKAAFGTWWTGKLSDVAGLAFAPALVAAAASLLAPRVRAASLAIGSIVSIGLVFTFMKTTTVGASAASEAWTAITAPIAGPSVILRDPTDLLTLPALALAWWTFTQVREARDPGRVLRAG